MDSIDNRTLEKVSIKAKWCISDRVVDELQHDGVVQSHEFYLGGQISSNCFWMVLKQSVVPNYIQLRLSAMLLDKGFLILISHSVWQHGQAIRDNFNKKKGLVCKFYICEIGRNIVAFNFTRVRVSQFQKSQTQVPIFSLQIERKNRTTFSLNI